MGLGKTVQTLAFLEHLKNQDALGPTLIVVPTSLTYNWESETQKFTQKIRFRQLGVEQPNEDLVQIISSADVWITTYGTLVTQRDRLLKIRWQNLIFDEAQYLKNDNS